MFENLSSHIESSVQTYLPLWLNRFLILFFWLGLAFFATWIIRKWFTAIMHRLIKKTKNQWDDILYKEHFFGRISYIIPPLILYMALDTMPWLGFGIIYKLFNIWFIIALLMIVFALLNTVNKIYSRYEGAKERPITVFIQIIKIFFLIGAIIIIFSLLFNKNPVNLILGLGAFAAVLMLIFKDSILGFVAGIQLTANKMVRIGDWIEMPQHNADGEVLEITLYTVRVRNWDMTISNVPTYSLVSESFTNWRGMQESKGRRIKRSIFIDIHSVHFLKEEEIEKLKDSKLLSGYINEVLGRLEEKNKDKGVILDQIRLTNIGVFRQYMQQWLRDNKEISKEMTMMVRQLQPTPTGIPIEVYCFSGNQVWTEYERIQADIFDHMMAIIPEFGLRVFEYISDFGSHKK